MGIHIWYIQKSSSTYLLAARRRAESRSNCLPKPQLHQRISELSAPGRKDRVSRESHCTSRDANSTESFLTSWLRAVTSLQETARVAKASTGKSLKMKTSSSSIPEGASSPWPMPVQAPMAPSSSSALSTLRILTALTLSLAKYLMVSPFLIRSNRIQLEQMTSQRKLWSSKIVDSCLETETRKMRGGKVCVKLLELSQLIQ